MKSQIAEALPVAEMKGKVGSFETFNVKGGKTFMIDFFGPYSKLGAAHGKMSEYMKEKNYKWVAPAIEEYLSDPMSQPDSTKWETKIYYFVE